MAFLESDDPASPFDSLPSQVTQDLKSLQPTDITQVNATVADIVRTARGTVPRLRKIRAEIAAETPRFDLSLIEKLAGYVNALEVTETACRAIPDRSSFDRELPARAFQHRDRLRKNAEILADAKLLDAKLFERLSGRKAHVNIADDLVELERTLRSAWPTIRNNCPLTNKDLQLATEMAAYLHARTNEFGADYAANLDLRARAFTLTVRTYNELRQAVTYVRRVQGDVDKVMPHLYAGKTRR